MAKPSGPRFTGGGFPLSKSSKAKSKLEAVGWVLLNNSLQFTLEHFGGISLKFLGSQTFREISPRIPGWKEMQNYYSPVHRRVMTFYLIHMDINRV